MAADSLEGRPGGQHYNVLRSIRDVLQQMAEHKIEPGPFVARELLQNADDAKATEVAFILDERSPPDVEWADKLWPALFVRNNAPFQMAEDQGGDSQHDDFEAIRDVARGHKLDLPTTAGRFGLGFNSVYFLTDIPLFFSRREVNLFDLTHSIVDNNGWILPLDAISAGGPWRDMLDAALPKSALGVDRTVEAGGVERSFDQIASQGIDYRQTVFRLPLRHAIRGAGERLAHDCFPDRSSRLALLLGMFRGCARSLLFLKHVQKVTFALLETMRGAEELGTVSCSPNPPEFQQFLKEVERHSRSTERAGEPTVCSPFDKQIQANWREPSIHWTWTFRVGHVARFDDAELHEHRAILAENDKKAIPWVSLAVPLDAESLRFERQEAHDRESPVWRTFLPLGEAGPCHVVASGAFFIGPSRRRVEFRTDTRNAEALQRTGWNRLLVQRALVPLFRDTARDLLKLVPELAAESPSDYLSLYPEKPANIDVSVADVFRRAFAAEGTISLLDVFGQRLEIKLGPSGEPMEIERVPEYLAKYARLFQDLSTPKRRFISEATARALMPRLGESPVVFAKGKATDAVRSVLRVTNSARGPDADDLQKLLEALPPDDLRPQSLQGLWAFRRAGEKKLVPFHPDFLYLIGDPGETSGIHQALRSLGIEFERVEWVDPTIGLAAFDRRDRAAFPLVREPDDASALELLRRVTQGTPLAGGTDLRLLDELIDFLARQPAAALTRDLRLSFLQRVPPALEPRRRLGAVFLRPEKQTSDESLLWTAWIDPVFASIDDALAARLHRLLARHRQLAPCLDEGAGACLVVGHLSQTLGGLVAAFQTAPTELVQAMRAAAAPVKPAQPAKRATPGAPVAGAVAPRREVSVAAALLVKEADRQWDALDESARLAVLALPIHPTAAGDLISLCTPDGKIEQVKAQFMIQSQEDLRGAPIQLPGRTLLHSDDRAVTAFYSERLEVGVQGHEELVLHCLRVMRNQQPNQRALLLYVASRYESLSKKSRAEADLLFRPARTVPTTDGDWQPREQCVDVREVERAITRIPQISADRHHTIIRGIAMHLHPADLSDTDVAAALARLGFAIDSLDKDSVAERALSSESRDLTLAERAQLVLAFRRSGTTRLPEPSPVVRDTRVPLLAGGSRTLRGAEIAGGADLTEPRVISKLFPNALDVEAIARDWGMCFDDAFRVLQTAFGVTVIYGPGVARGVRDNLARVWPSLDATGRFGLLRGPA